jgi:hypothetical protein
MIGIVEPEVIVSFGNLGCRNVASILLQYDKGNRDLKKLAKSLSPLKEMESISKGMKKGEGIKTRYNSRDMVFRPLYQPARSNVYGYPGEYAKLRSLLV